MSEFKVTGYKINIQNKLYFSTLAMSNLKLRKQFIYNKSKRIKYLAINLAKVVQDLYIKNNKPLSKDIKEL